MKEALLEPTISSEIQIDPEILCERREVLDDYLDSLMGFDALRADEIASSLLQNPTPIANTIVIIPVAAHQEAPQIERALEQYARQETNEPFTVILGLNYPSKEAKSEEITETLIEIEKARLEHPNLDLRTTLMSYRKPTIGKIRRDLWNGVALASRSYGNFNEGEDVIGINNDIDLLWMESSYIAQIQKEYRDYESEAPNWIVMPLMGTRLLHGLSADHPNTSSVIDWLNIMYGVVDAKFEASCVIPMSYYAEHGGFDKKAKKGEVLGIMDPYLMYGRLIPGASAETSPRRYLTHMDEKGHNIWDGTFKATDTCRENVPPPDISEKRKNEIIESTFESFGGFVMYQMGINAHNDYVSAGNPIDDPIAVIRAVVPDVVYRVAYARDRFQNLLSTVTDSIETLEKSEEYFSGNWLSHALMLVLLEKGILIEDSPS